MEKDFENIIYNLLFDDLFYLIEGKSVIINNTIMSMSIKIKDIMYPESTYELTFNKDTRAFDIEVLSGDRYKYYKRHIKITNKLLNYIKNYYKY